MLWLSRLSSSSACNHFAMASIVGSCRLTVAAALLLVLGGAVSARQPPSLSSRATDPATSVWTWGPYRPNLYFAIRPQVPETLLMGLMWAGGDNKTALLSSTRPAHQTCVLTLC